MGTIEAGVLKESEHRVVFCSHRSTGATTLPNFRPPTADELGYAKSITVQEIGGTPCIVLEQGKVYLGHCDKKPVDVISNYVRLQCTIL